MIVEKADLLIQPDTAKLNNISFCLNSMIYKHENFNKVRKIFYHGSMKLQKGYVSNICEGGYKTIYMHRYLALTLWEKLDSKTLRFKEALIRITEQQKKQFLTKFLKMQVKK